MFETVKSWYHMISLMLYLNYVVPDYDMRNLQIQKNLYYPEWKLYSLHYL